ncbi:cupin domain-containing protein [Paraburkholderia sp.]|uniref:cupin domain-containing protein n=1 Tax=Paraburkholderia sp. TaxID=1926495 RepID=UPI00239ABE65|nr:cupin domain-containing protein [Paraburkholderia sp.]MDE1180443.1 cupin domain-containing protein [Paraburkholderia sp.]
MNASTQNGSLDAADTKDRSTHCRLNDGGFITRSALIPWTRLNKPGLEGIQYKILNFDENRSYMVVLNTFDPGSRFAPHKHLGAVEIFMLSGSFFYDNGQVFADDFMLEAGGVTHAPGSDEGALMLAIFHGPLQILDNEGQVLVTVGIDEMYDLAKDNDAVAHLQKTQHRVALTSEG